MMQKMMDAQTSVVKVCELCGSANHITDVCPTRHNDDVVDVNVMGGFQQFNINEPSLYLQQIVTARKMMDLQPINDKISNNNVPSPEPSEQCTLQSVSKEEELQSN